MRIAIVTHILMHNYGGTLQAYAMQEALRRLGHDPVTVDYVPDRMSKLRYVLAQMKTALMLGRGGRKFFAWPRRERLPQFSGFMRRHITLTERVNHYTESVLRKYGTEAIVVGSDQVWRAAFHKPSVQPDLFLRFARHLNVPKVAYAASFGVDYWEMSPKLTRECAKYARLFNAISTREDSGVELCKKYLGVDAVSVHDPTLLLDRDDYAGLCSDVPHASGKFLLAYMLDANDTQKQVIKQFADRMGLPVKFYTSEKNVELTVEQWLAMFRDASMVVTNSFHGTVFSIINNKDFYSIVNGWRGTDRFVSLLSHFGLLGRLLLDARQLPDNPPALDWERINTVRKKWQAAGIGFLKANLIKGNK